MKAIAVLGSRNEAGQTARAALALIEGLASQGYEAEKFFLPKVKIERCRQCDDNGWGICRSKGACIIEDDFASLIAKIKEADLLILATPVYFSDLSESLRAFLDRLRRTCMNENGKKGITGKPAIGICVAGGGGGGAPACALSLEKVLATCGFDLIDVVLVRRQNLALKLALLRETGKWLKSHLAERGS